MTSAQKLFAHAAVAALCTAAAMPAFAQDAERDPDTVQEVVVTAQKREQSTKDVPISITAFTAEQLEERNITDLSKLSLYTPSLTVTPSPGGGAGITMRGITTGVGGVGVDPSIGVYVDGAYVSREWVALQGYLDVDRVEVLRGPQGTLYGRNTTGGAYNVIHKTPGADFEAGVSAQFESYDRQRYEAYVSGPLIGDVLSGRLALGKETAEEYGKNLYTNERLQANDLKQALGTLVFKPTDDFTVTLRGDTMEDGARVGAVYHLVRPGTGNAAADLPSSPYEYRTDFRTDSNSLTNSGWTLQADWGFGGGYELKSITAGRLIKIGTEYDSDQSELALYTAVTDSRSKTFSQELQLTSPTGEKYDWILGAYYYTEDADDYVTSGGPSSLSLPTGLYVAPGFTPLNISIPFENRTVFESHNKTESWAAFGELRYRFTPQWQATIGLRYTDENRKFDGYARRMFDDAEAGFDSTAACQALIAANTVTWPATDHQATCVSYADFYADYYVNTTDAFAARDQQELNFTNLSARFVIDYYPNEETHVYGSATSGFKSGGFNSYDTNTILVDADGDGYVTAADAGMISFQPPFDPEKLWSYEVGVKGSLFDRKVQYSLNAFYYDWSNIQAQVYNYTNRTSFITNDAQAEAYGIEGDAYARPWSGGLVDFNISWIHSEYTHFGSTIDDVVTGATNQDFTGTPLPGSPEWKWNLGIQHTLYLKTAGDLTLRGEWQHRSDTFYVYTRDPDAKGGDYDIMNLRLTWRDPSQRFTGSVYVENVFDEYYDYYRYGSSLTGVTAMVAPPRIVGARLSASF